MEEIFGRRIERVVDSTYGEGGERLTVKKPPLPDEGSVRGPHRQLKVAIGSDHRGLVLKGQLKGYLLELGHTVVDCGADGHKPADYPDVALSVSEKVARKICDFGILIDAVGVGSGMAANKVKGIRAAVCHDVESARSSRLHNDANVLSLGASTVNRGLARRMVRIWLETPFEGGRHTPRIEKIAKIEREGLDARL